MMTDNAAPRRLLTGRRRRVESAAARVARRNAAVFAARTRLRCDACGAFLDVQLRCRACENGR